jgi:hypothetical protein
MNTKKIKPNFQGSEDSEPNNPVLLADADGNVFYGYKLSTVQGEDTTDPLESVILLKRVGLHCFFDYVMRWYREVNVKITALIRDRLELAYADAREKEGDQP